MSESITKEEDIKYQLCELSNFEKEDLDYPEFDVYYETDGGVEGAVSVCCIDLAKRAHDRIEQLEAEIKLLRG